MVVDREFIDLEFLEFIQFFDREFIDLKFLEFIQFLTENLLI